MKEKFYFLLFVLIIPILIFNCSNVKRESTSLRSDKHNLGVSLKILANQLLSNIDIRNKKVAIFDFHSLDGKESTLGAYIAEGLTTELYSTKRVEIIERRLLKKVIEEQKLSLSGLIDLTTAQEIGKMIGAQLIISGTYSDLGDIVTINARLISVEKGNVVGVGTVDMVKDDRVQKLLLTKEESPKIKDTSKESGKPKSDTLLSRIVVHIDGSTRSAVGLEINVGGSVVLTAHGLDANGNWIYIEPTWRASKPKIIEITPEKGDKVTVKGLSPGVVDIIVEYAGVKHTVQFLFVQ